MSKTQTRARRGQSGEQRLGILELLDAMADHKFLRIVIDRLERLAGKAVDQGAVEDRRRLGQARAFVKAASTCLGRVFDVPEVPIDERKRGKLERLKAWRQQKAASAASEGPRPPASGGDPEGAPASSGIRPGPPGVAGPITRK